MVTNVNTIIGEGELCRVVSFLVNIASYSIYGQRTRDG